MNLPDGTPLSALGLSSMIVLPHGQGGQARNLLAWFGPWARIVAPISDEKREELAKDGLIVLSLLDFNPHFPQVGAHVNLFGVGVQAE